MTLAGTAKAKSLNRMATNARFWPIASTVNVGFGATQVRRLLAAVEINDRIGADRPISAIRRLRLLARQPPFAASPRQRCHVSIRSTPVSSHSP
jgi:hypothetical protein